LHDSINAGAGSSDGFVGDLLTIYRRFRQNYAEQDDAQAAAARALEKYSQLSQDPDVRRASIARRQSERGIALTDQLGASAEAAGCTAGDGAVKTGTSGDLPEVRLEGGKGDEGAEMFADSNASDGRTTPLFAPKFLGHYNYGFEYQKWALEEEERRASSSTSLRLPASAI
jgi:hypothetical protein